MIQIKIQFILFNNLLMSSQNLCIDMMNLCLINHLFEKLLCLSMKYTSKFSPLHFHHDYNFFYSLSYIHFTHGSSIICSTL